jgi:hypothetical protein
MPRRPPTSKAIPPLYLLRAGETCPQCGQGTNVFALLASSVYDGVEEYTLPVVLLLNGIETLPPPVLDMLQQRCFGWRFDHERHGEPSYLMNHCLCCGAKLADNYLHAEPGSAFFPTSPDECWNISMFELPVEEEVPLRCGWISGGLTDWLEPEQAKPWQALPLASAYA